MICYYNIQGAGDARKQPCFKSPHRSLSQPRPQVIVTVVPCAKNPNWCRNFGSSYVFIAKAFARGIFRCRPLNYIPIPVLNGLFLYLAVTALSG